MALTVSEASAVNDLIDYITGARGSSGRTDEEWNDVARDAAALLADKARQKLMAGIDGPEVRRRWRRVEACAWHDDAT